MLEKIVYGAIRHRWIVIVGSLLLGLVGAWSLAQLPIDAVPDITNVQVQINTEAPGYSPLEAEQRITFPIETAMAGLPRLSYTRSLSRYGLSQVTVVFEDGTDIYFARQLVNERLQGARSQLPDGLEPEIGPIATGLGEIYMYTVEAEPGARKPDGSRMDADRSAHHPGLDRPPATAQRARHYRGQHDRRLRAPDPDRAGPGALIAFGLTCDDLMQALALNNANRRRRLHRAQRRAVPGARSRARSPRLEDIGQIVVATREGVSIRMQRCCRGAGGRRAAHWRRHREWHRGGAGHGVHADRREQPRRGAGQRRQRLEEIQKVAAARVSWSRRCTTAPRWSTAPSAPWSRTSRTARCW